VSATVDTRPVILWLGLGQMGGTLAARLERDFRVVGVDPLPSASSCGIWRRAETVKRATTDGVAPWAVVLCLPDPVSFLDAISEITSTAIVADSARHVINLSTVGPSAAAHAAGIIERTRKIQYVESLITGGVQRAATGDITLLVACSGELSQGVRALLETLAARLNVLESIEAVATAKLVNNVAMLGTASATVEALDLGRRHGLATDTMFRVLQDGTANSYILNNSLRRALIDNDTKTGFAARLALKDLELALELAARVGCELTHARIVHAELRKLIGNGGADETFARIGTLRGFDYAAGVDSSMIEGATATP
jgi:3-hydroxyisobutyrate dehydrogenase-like beta-hydroxyacid dehydrogenase